jgi:hypothetical protein
VAVAKTFKVGHLGAPELFQVVSDLFNKDAVLPKDNSSFGVYREWHHPLRHEHRLASRVGNTVYIGGGL